MAKVGILALQGAFIEHKKILESLGAECVEIRQKKDLKDLAGIVLPAGKVPSRDNFSTNWIFLHRFRKKSSPACLSLPPAPD